MNIISKIKILKNILKNCTYSFDNWKMKIELPNNRLISIQFYFRKTVTLINQCVRNTRRCVWTKRALKCLQCIRNTHRSVCDVRRCIRNTYRNARQYVYDVRWCVQMKCTLKCLQCKPMCSKHAPKCSRCTPMYSKHMLKCAPICL